MGKKIEKWGKNKKKTVGGVSSSQDWSQRKPLGKINIFLEKALVEETTPNSKKWVRSLKNRDSQIFSQNFSNVDI